MLFKISQDVLIGEGVSYHGTPNRGYFFCPSLPDTIVIHYTAGASLASSVKALCDPRKRVSAHLVIGRDGSVVQLVRFNRIAWHAGKSAWGQRVGLNDFSIGIELDNAGRLTKRGDEYITWWRGAIEKKDVLKAQHQFDTGPGYWHRYTKPQLRALQQICKLLANEYGIKEIVGHDEISPARKQDPGPAFPMKEARRWVLKGRLRRMFLFLFRM